MCVAAVTIVVANFCLQQLVSALTSPYWDNEFESRCRRGVNFGGQCRDFFFRNILVSPIISQHYSPLSSFPISYHLIFQFHSNINKTGWLPQVTMLLTSCRLVIIPSLACDLKPLVLSIRARERALVLRTPFAEMALFLGNHGNIRPMADGREVTCG